MRLVVLSIITTDILLLLVYLVRVGLDRLLVFNTF